MGVLSPLLLLLAVFGVVVSDDSVHVLQFTNNYRQKVTSSTLYWVSASNGIVPEFAVVAGTETITEDTEDSDAERKPATNIYVCRARQGGSWLPGQLIPQNKVCLVSLLTKVAKFDKYEVLQNFDNAARLAWVKWDKYQKFPHGAVLGGVNANFCVARRKVEVQEDNSLAGHLRAESYSFSHYIGKYMPDDGLGKIAVITEDNSEAVYADGEVLTEVEPVRYDLTTLKYNKQRRRVAGKRVALATTTLRNDEQRRVKLDSVLAYDSEYMSSWGTVRGVLKGLSTTVRDVNGSVLTEIKWGLPEQEDRKDVYRVEVELEAGTAVNITLVGNHTESEMPYTAKLVSLFDHLPASDRVINGARREVQMLNVHPEFGAVYFTGNMSMVPTTTTTTTSTTTTTTTTTTTEAPPVPAHPNKSPDNNIKGENSASMLSDESAQSLQKQQEQQAGKTDSTARGPSGGSGGAAAIMASVTSLAAAVALATAT